MVSKDPTPSLLECESKLIAIAFFFMIMTVLTFFYVLAAFRTNITLVITFFFIDMAFFMLMSTYWVAAEGRATTAGNLQIVSEL